MKAAQENFYKEEVGRLRAELAGAGDKCEQLRSALTDAVDTLEEDAIAQRAFWGAADKHGIAAEAERIYEKAKAALSPNASDEPRPLGAVGSGRLFERPAPDSK